MFAARSTPSGMTGSPQPVLRAPRFIPFRLLQQIGARSLHIAGTLLQRLDMPVRLRIEHEKNAREQRGRVPNMIVDMPETVADRKEVDEHKHAAPSRDQP